jgi:hypothetical protein
MTCGTARTSCTRYARTVFNWDVFK